MITSIDSKVIKRLVAMQAATVIEGTTGDCCLLFVRFEGAPYACLGKCLYYRSVCEMRRVDGVNDVTALSLQVDCDGSVWICYHRR